MILGNYSGCRNHPLKFYEREVQKIYEDIFVKHADSKKFQLGSKYQMLDCQIKSLLNR